VREQTQDQSKQQQQENDETKKQIEEDADRELLNMRIRHEQLVREQLVSSVNLLPKRSGVPGGLVARTYAFQRGPLDLHMVRGLQQKNTLPISISF